MASAHLRALAKLARHAASRSGGRYVEFCKSTFPTSSTARLPPVVDCAHGAVPGGAGVFRARAEVIAVGAAPDGFNQRGCGATHPAFLAGEVKKHGAHIGIALDGDGDRLLCRRGGSNLRRRPAALRDRTDYRRRGVPVAACRHADVELGFEQALAREASRSSVPSRRPYVLESWSSASGCSAARTRPPDLPRPPHHRRRDRCRARGAARPDRAGHDARAGDRGGAHVPQR